MPLFDCDTPLALTGYDSTQDCPDGDGILALYLAEYKSVDWENSTFTDGELTAYTMNGTDTFFEVQTEQENAFYDATYTEDAGIYDIVATFFIMGATCEATEFINSMRGKCLVAHVILNNCTERVLGVEYLNDKARPAFRKLRLGRHLNSSGQIGSSRARDEFDLTAGQLAAPLCASVGEDSIPLPTPV